MRSIFISRHFTGTIPEYKIGLRYEPSPFSVFALTYGQEIGGNLGAGWEFGVMLFSPPFACFGCATRKPGTVFRQ